MLPEASGSAEPARSIVFLFSSPSAIIRSTATSSTGSYQDDKGVARAFLGAIGGRLEGGSGRIWSLWKQGARKGIWSKAMESNEGKCSSCQLFVSRAVAEAAWGSGDAHVLSINMRQPRPQAVGARGSPHLPLGFASKPNPSAPWARGLLSASWERGSPDLPACSPRRGSTSRPVHPIFTSKHSRPSRGAKPCEADDARPP